MNTFASLRAARLQAAQKPFRARGSAVVRCEQCLIARAHCICAWRVEVSCQYRLRVIMHREEVLKPSNTGRLIEAVLPAASRVYEWSRLEPSEELLADLENEDAPAYVVFPGEADSSPPPPDATLVLLDGTWRQASRMVRSSPWLARLPRLALSNVPEAGQYSVRKALKPGQLATAEAAACALEQLGDTTAAEALRDYFLIFDAHYGAARMCLQVPPETPAHARQRLRLSRQRLRLSRLEETGLSASTQRYPCR